MQSKPFAEEAGDLPMDRSKEAEPFEISGVNFSGPLSYTSRNPNGQLNTTFGGKAYICLFTCAVTRAVYLELSPNLSAENFVLTLTRFYLRVNRGLSVMYSDNAKTFVRAAKYLKRLHGNEGVSSFLGDHQTSWEFVASRAPWWNGM